MFALYTNEVCTTEPQPRHKQAGPGIPLTPM